MHSTRPLIPITGEQQERKCLQQRRSQQESNPQPWQYRRSALFIKLQREVNASTMQCTCFAFLQHANTFWLNTYVKQMHKQHFKICVAGVPVVVLRWLQVCEKWSDASSVSNTAFERVLGGPCWLLHSVSEISTRCGRTQSRHRSSCWQKLRGASSHWRRKVRMAGANYGLRIET